jgi:hypothetical protein
MAYTPRTPPVSGRSSREHTGGGVRGAFAEVLRRLMHGVERVVPALMVIALGILLGMQYMQPDKRVLSVIAIVILSGIAWRLDLVTSIGLMIFLLPFPKTTSFGSTNTAIALLVAILWLVNASQGRAPGLRRTPVDAAVLGLVLVYGCSFYNVTDPAAMPLALSNFQVVLASVLSFYVIVSNVNTSKALQKIHDFQIACAVCVLLLAVYELGHPGALLGGWIKLGASAGMASSEGINLHALRIGSSFNDYELLSEFCVITMLLALFLWVRATSTFRRVVLSAFLLLNLFVMFATVTRGAFFSLGAGLLVLLWTTRRRVKFVPMVVGISLGLALFIGMNFYVANYTASGNMFGRLSQTHFEGFVPDSRAGIWEISLRRAMLHPWIGAGPFFSQVFGFQNWDPHNVFLYYAIIVGFTGLGFFILILVGLARMTVPTVDDLRHPDYARAFQVVVQAQFVAFVVNETKIDYVRNPIYSTVVWAMYAMWIATYFVVRSNLAAESKARPALGR